jgi:hypothetical protein
MNTLGLAVSDGYVHGAELTNSAGYGAIPLQFWHRLKHQLGLKNQLGAFRMDYATTRDAIKETVWDSYTDGLLAEQALFTRWVHALGTTLPESHYGGELWPWSRGWTEDLIDSYLTTPTGATP